MNLKAKKIKGSSTGGGVNLSLGKENVEKLPKHFFVDIEFKNIVERESRKKKIDCEVIE